MRCLWLGRRYLGRTIIADSTIRNVDGFKMFSYGEREIYIACIVAVAADRPSSSIGSNCMVLALECLYIVYDIHSEVRRMRAEQKNTPHISK